MSTATVRDSDGTPYVVTNTVRDSDGTPYDVDAYVRDSDGTPYLIFGGAAPVVDGDVGLGGKKHKRQRYNLAQLMHEDELILGMIKQFMDRVH